MHGNLISCRPARGILVIYLIMIKSKKIVVIFYVVIFLISSIMVLADSDKLRIIVIGAHPDDPEAVGATMMKFVQAGHMVRMVSMTNGNAGHFSEGGGPLAQRRYKETRCSSAITGCEYIVIDNDDGKLMPTLENRNKVIAQIREFKADVVISHRPNDYHPDHRNAGLLVRDAAYMVTVPNIVPSVPHLRKNPLFMYMYDRFTVPNPFEPEIVVDISDLMDKKLDIWDCHVSQMYEWIPYNMNILDQVPEGAVERKAWLKKAWSPFMAGPVAEYKDKLVELYGAERAAKVTAVEAFQVSEYGSNPGMETLKKMFPFFP
jgi:LmbE family N-acetylglucosaminyl deacetylase